LEGRASIIRNGMSRYRTLLSLGAVVLVVGLASLIATGAIRRAPPSPRATPTVAPSPVPPSVTPSPVPPLPTPPSCTTDQLELVGVFNDCGVPVATTAVCSVSGNVFDVVVQLHGVGGGTPHDYFLYLSIGDGYHGRGIYANSTVSAMVREYATGALWRSISGVVLRVSGSDGRSGTVKAALSYVGGEPTPPTVGLNISGPWRCV
jgi:hypothetical protein